MQILSRLCESHGTPAALFYLLQHLVNRGLLGQAPQFAGEVLLKRLPPSLCTSLKRRMHVVRKITDKHIHACSASSPSSARISARTSSRLGWRMVTVTGDREDRASAGRRWLIAGPGLEDGLQIAPGRLCVYPSLIDGATAGLGYAHRHVG